PRRGGGADAPRRWLRGVRPPLRPDRARVGTSSGARRGPRARLRGGACRVGGARGCGPAPPGDAAAAPAVVGDGAGPRAYLSPRAGGRRGGPALHRVALPRPARGDGPRTS